ncbi:hypothetical protein THRCLA_04947 [Thraustotheca clavata]|uniref:Uncharacterized protein n=1 Tax=Thraustotheca clavata TaxID=74557 RepID=A0A1V9ZXF9_9STRA|nr:hypothetical protein THRCLA_04947 [Thraustotheca clavata]
MYNDYFASSWATSNHQRLRQSIRELQRETLKDLARHRNQMVYQQLQMLNIKTNSIASEDKNKELINMMSQVLTQQQNLTTLLQQQPKVIEKEAKQEGLKDLPLEKLKQTTSPSTRRQKTPNPEKHIDSNRSKTPLSQQQVPHNEDFLWSEEDQKLMTLPEDDDILQAFDYNNSKSVEESKTMQRQDHKKLIIQQNNDATKRPKWRMDQDGEYGIVSAFEETAMNSREIFRAVVLAVQFSIGIQKLYLKRQKGIKADEEKAFMNMLSVYFDATKTWLSKEIKIPILSVLQDTKLNFASEVSDKGLKKKLNALFVRKQTATPDTLLQLKVRLKGIVDAIVKTAEKSGSIPKPILIFLLKLVSDGVYFPPQYLSSEECSGLEFNVLGATRNMNLPFSDREDYYTRFNLIVLDFILIRVVIPHIVLRPHECGIGGRAKPPKDTENNLKVLATGLYVICQYVIPLLPEVTCILRYSTNLE